MRKTKKMLLGLMVCGAIALVGGMAANAYEAETVSANAETTFNETETSVTKIHLRNKRLLMFLDACDYASTSGTTPANATYAGRTPAPPPRTRMRTRITSAMPAVRRCKQVTPPPMRKAFPAAPWRPS